MDLPPIIIDSRRRSASPTEGKGKENDSASGFILKLYQMVNEAPDEVMSWTPDGSAFIVGSDVKRLETEALPQFFRHNRFPSLVRQLNFYSFRKINKERHVWIYKHPLFHRDYPEKLGQVRRRTCPGKDGRKDRLFRLSVRKLAGAEDDDSDDENSLFDIDTILQAGVEAKAMTKKRVATEPMAFLSMHAPAPKRISLSSSEGSRASPDFTTASLKTEFAVACAVMQDSGLLPTVSLDEASKALSKSEQAQRSSVVSEVASKLEAYGRLAGHNTNRPRRSGSGVVTPPYGAYGQPAIPSRDLLTYDDELNEAAVVEMSRPNSSLGFLPEDGPSKVSTQSVTFQDNIKSPITAVPPVADLAQVKDIVHRILQAGPACITMALLAGFCMAEAPHDNEDLDQAIFKLITSHSTLRSEFQQYRAALQPLGAVVPLSEEWRRPCTREKGVRDFKVFAVNKLFEVATLPSLPANEQQILHHTASIWQNSAMTA